MKTFYTIQMFFILIYSTVVSGQSIDSLVRTTTFDILYGKSQKNPFCRIVSPKDISNLAEYSYLIDQKPSLENYKKYSALAVSLWNCDSVSKAERMFLNIVNSNEDFYTSNYRHRSDVSGDTGNIYGYGSFISNYKNKACRYLCMIHICKKEYSAALDFVIMADTLYHVYYSCGTGSSSYRDELNDLYCKCYNGLKMYRKTVDLKLQYLTDGWNVADDEFYRAFWNCYPYKERCMILDSAIQSLTYSIDTLMVEVIGIKNGSNMHYSETRTCIDIQFKMLGQYFSYKDCASGKEYGDYIDLSLVNKAYVENRFKKLSFYEKLSSIN